MIIEYKEVIIKLINKSNKCKLTKDEQHRLDKLNTWYFNELHK